MNIITRRDFSTMIGILKIIDWKKWEGKFNWIENFIAQKTQRGKKRGLLIIIYKLLKWFQKISNQNITFLTCFSRQKNFSNFSGHLVNGGFDPWLEFLNYMSRNWLQWYENSSWPWVSLLLSDITVSGALRGDDL